MNKALKIYVLLENNIPVAFTVNGSDADEWQAADSNHRKFTIVGNLTKKLTWIIDGKVSYTQDKVESDLYEEK